MNQAITQSLAGRIGILTLLPLSIHEYVHNSLDTSSYNQIITNGGYPRIHTDNITPSEFYPSYIQTYVERDVRLLTNVENLSTFKKFMQLCAGRVGQLLNIADIATQCGINQKTANNWIAILEASYIIFLLQPYHGNFNKRVIKTPKLYFYDTGLASSLLGLKNEQEASLSPFRGYLFECLIIADLFKQFFNKGETAPLYFWRDKNGSIEVDCLIAQANKLIPLEIKSGQTIVSDFFAPLERWKALTASDFTDGYIVYGGDEVQQRSAGTVIGWRQSGVIIDQM